MPLNEQDRQKLDNIVLQMQNNKESESNIKLVVEDFKSKYDRDVSPMPAANIEGGGVPVEASQEFVSETGKMIKNIPSSAYRFGEGIVNTIDPRNWYDILKGLKGTAIGIKDIAFGDDETDDAKAAKGVWQFFVDRYGGIENIKNTIVSDPVGFMADVSTFVGAGGLVLKGVSKTGEAISNVRNVNKGNIPYKTAKERTIANAKNYRAKEIDESPIKRTAAEKEKSIIAAGKVAGQEFDKLHASRIDRASESFGNVGVKLTGAAGAMNPLNVIPKAVATGVKYGVEKPMKGFAKFLYERSMNEEALKAAKLTKGDGARLAEGGLEHNIPMPDKGGKSISRVKKELGKQYDRVFEAAVDETGRIDRFEVNKIIKLLEDEKQIEAGNSLGTEKIAYKKKYDQIIQDLRDAADENGFIDVKHAQRIAVKAGQSVGPRVFDGLKATVEKQAKMTSRAGLKTAIGEELSDGVYYNDKGLAFSGQQMRELFPDGKIPKNFKYTDFATIEKNWALMEDLEKVSEQVLKAEGSRKKLWGGVKAGGASVGAGLLGAFFNHPAIGATAAGALIIREILKNPKIKSTFARMYHTRANYTSGQANLLFEASKTPSYRTGAGAALAVRGAGLMSGAIPLKEE